MTHTQQIEEAVKVIREYRHSVTWDKGSSDKYIKATETLLSLAQSVLKCEGWPEDKKIDWRAGRTIHPTSIDYEAGFNSALHLCRLAHAKNCQECRDNVPSEDEIIRVLQIGILPTAIARDDATGIFKDGDNVKTLAQAIHTLITGKMKGEMKGEGRCQR